MNSDSQGKVAEQFCESKSPFARSQTIRFFDPADSSFVWKQPRFSWKVFPSSRIALFLIYPICVFVITCSNASAQSQYQSSTDFAKFAMKLREDELSRIKPNVMMSPTRTTFTGSGPRYLTYNGPRFATGTGAIRVLMIGDSLTVGGFGEAMQDYFLKRFGRNNVAVYAACGSSPEQWLRSGPEFLTKCGYREQTPHTTILYDFVNGIPPQPAVTPKLEDLIGSLRPTTLIVQLGTNWMDGMLGHSVGDDSNYSQILDRFVAAVHDGPNTVRQIIWITPPDSSRYSNEVKRSVRDLIKCAAQKYSFQMIDSGSMTHYVPGRSGGDGVHYNSEEAKQWASLVTRELDHMLR
jgi:hypothetical protein